MQHDCVAFCNKIQAERSYRAQVQLFETTNYKQKATNIKQGTRITQRIHNDSSKGLQYKDIPQHLRKRLDKDLW